MSESITREGFIALVALVPLFAILLLGSAAEWNWRKRK